MFLHENKLYFEAAVTACSQSTGISKAIIEKDYYVTLVLNEISTLQQSTPVYFKGGTALYKALKSIRRFSEDIDLTVRISDCLTNSQAKKRLECSSTKLKTLSRDKENIMNENAKGSITAIYTYDTFLPTLEPDILQRFGVLKVEATSFTVSEPTQPLEVEPILYTMSNPDIKLELSKFNIKPFDVDTVALERIFADKILAAEFYTERENTFDVAKHTYDLCVMLQLPQVKALMQNDSAFIKMLSYKRMEENVRIGSDLATKPLEKLAFYSSLFSPSFVSAYDKMQSYYVINPADKIPHSSLVANISPLNDYLSSISKKEQDYLNSLEYKIEKSKLIKQTQDTIAARNDLSKGVER